MANLYGYNTSTARKLNETDIRYGQNLHKELHRENKRTEIRHQASNKTKQKKGFSGFFAIVVCFAVAFAVVNGYVAINEANNEISDLKAEYNNIVASNQSIQVKIDKAIDLGQLQTVAGEKFGMARPERYQMFYVDLDMDDFSENTVDNGKAEKEKQIANMGVPGIITGTLNLFQ